MAWFTSEELFDALIQCLKRGVKVEMILLDHPTNWQPYAPDFSLFQQEKGILRIAGSFDRMMHNKFCVIDETVTITGSYNWTYAAENKNTENIIITDDVTLAKAYLAEFNRLSSSLRSDLPAKKLTWTEVETIDMAEMLDLQQEVSHITSARKLPKPVINVVQKPVIQVLKPKKPTSRYEIGLEVEASQGQKQWVPFINARKELPYNSHTLQFEADGNDSDATCVIQYKTGTGYHMLLNKSIAEIVSGSSRECLQISIQFSLAVNGYLHAEISCSETGKAIDMSIINPNLVTDED